MFVKYCSFKSINIHLSKVGAEPVPGYKHEPPQTKPHILLHYCTFKVKKTKQKKRKIQKG